jgi:hypothetical protein
MALLHHDLEDEVPVCIVLEKDTLKVVPDSVPISIKGNHRVHWFLHGEGTIDSVKFDSGTGPFHAEHHAPKSKKHVLSRRVVDTNHVGKKFKYTVFVTTSAGKKISLDPDVHILP